MFEANFGHIENIGALGADPPKAVVTRLAMAELLNI
jgi:hypothetical protein